LESIRIWALSKACGLALASRSSPGIYAHQIIIIITTATNFRLFMRSRTGGFAASLFVAYTSLYWFFAILNLSGQAMSEPAPGRSIEVNK